MKNRINILSTIFLASAAGWVISLIASQLIPYDAVSAIFLIFYIITVFTALAFVIGSIIVFATKKYSGFSKPLFFFACAVLAAWVGILVALIDYANNLF
ncbi:MAG: hypothetical protein U0M02_06825 [Acutalibacteraceae bacterium]|nr:hypothetical protein [Acutalibacteraceae bacterium]